MMNQFYGKEGTLAFVIPFSFITDNKKATNVCKDIFCKIKPKDNREQYEYYKDELVTIISKSFPNATNCFCGASERNKQNEFIHNCYFCKSEEESKPYIGRNLCHCFSICRKFHDDQSQDTPRIEIYLGTNIVQYEFPDCGIPDSEKNFEFYIDALLLLTNATGGEAGYLVYNISLASIRGDYINKLTGNSLDNFIFIKHLFYKSRLKCSINDEPNISIQEWAGKYFNELMSVLGTKKVEGISFRYSIMELNDIFIKEGDSSEKMLPLPVTNKLLTTYRNQIYGLMVSDEGWRYISKHELKQKFKDNHWSSRSFSTAFFLGHNALIINQYNLAQSLVVNKQRGYQVFSENWFRIYAQSSESNFYTKYAQLRPCIPGVGSLILYAFLKAIYKELILATIKNLSDGNSFTDEEKYKKLAFALQQHSMSLDAIKNVEDCIYSQFGIPAELNALRESYQREANNVQNKKVVNLTHVTACISLSALVIASLTIGLKGGDSLFVAGMDWTIVILVAALLIPMLIYIVIQNNLWEKYKIGRNK